MLINSPWPGGIAPRTHARKYLELSKQERAEYFESIPDELKEWVKFYVKDYLKRNKFRRK